MNENIFEYGFESVNGIVKKQYHISEIPKIKHRCDVWDSLNLIYTRQYAGFEDINKVKVFIGDTVFVNDGYVGKNREIVWNEKGKCLAYKILDDVESSTGANLKGEIRDIGTKSLNDVTITGSIYVVDKVKIK
ncbi:MAG: hypothetical protein ACJA2M_000327 [Polaribacter sp.]|jgi:hypothetical protein